MRLLALAFLLPAEALADARVDALIAQLTLDEKLALVEGAPEPDGPDNLYQAGFLPGVPRLGIPPLRLADGPPGVATRKPSTGMPCTMAGRRDLRCARRRSQRPRDRPGRAPARAGRRAGAL
jgi:hypothetical protein